LRKRRYSSEKPLHNLTLPELVCQVANRLLDGEVRHLWRHSPQRRVRDRQAPRVPPDGLPGRQCYAARTAKIDDSLLSLVETVQVIGHAVLSGKGRLFRRLSGGTSDG